MDFSASACAHERTFMRKRFDFKVNIEPVIMIDKF